MFEDFGDYIVPGDTFTTEAEGFTLTATIYRDDFHGAPWVEEDGRGSVSDWRGRETKRPGEMALAHSDFGGYRFYDFAEACRIARRDGWGARTPGLPADHPDAYKPKPGETAKAYAARAAMDDFRRLKAWCDDEWFYVGVAVTAEKDGVLLTDKYECSLWGIESDAGDYLAEVANELAADAIDAAKAKLASLSNGDAAKILAEILAWYVKDTSKGGNMPPELFDRVQAVVGNLADNGEG